MPRRPITAGTSAAAPIRMSASMMATVLGCPRKGQNRYIHKLPEKPAIPMWRGSRLHEAIEAWHGEANLAVGTAADVLVHHLTGRWRDQAAAVPGWGELMLAYLDLRGEMAVQLDTLDELAAKIKADAQAGRRPGGATAPRMTKDFKTAEERLLRPWRDTLDSLRAAERTLIDDPAGPWETTSRSGIEEYETSLTTARDYVRWWVDLGEDRPEILHQEQWFEVEMAGFQLRGRTDRIVLDPTVDAVVVDDLKTGRSDGKLERWIQAAFYAIGAEQAAGVRPEYVRFVNLDAGPSTHTYRVRPRWDLELVKLCGYAHELLTGPSIPSFQGCGWCAFQARCFSDEGLMQFTALEDSDDSAAEEVASS